MSQCNGNQSDAKKLAMATVGSCNMVCEKGKPMSAECNNCLQVAQYVQNAVNRQYCEISGETIADYNISCGNINKNTGSTNPNDRFTCATMVQRLV